MKLFFYFAISLFMTLSSVAKAEVNSIPHPQDTTSSFTDKVAATYLIEDGKKYFYQGEIREAMRKFREAYVRDPKNYKAAYWIGEAHYKLNNYGYALKYGKIAEVLSKAADGDVFYLLARSYHRLNILDSAAMDYDLAKIQLSRIKQSSYEINHKIQEVKYAQSVEKNEMRFEKKLLSDNVNSGYDDYSAVLSNDGKSLYFVSRRPDTKGGNVNPSDQQFFEDIYKSQWDAKTNKWDVASNKIERMNSDGFDAIGYISQDGDRAYITLNTSVLDKKETTKSSDIAVAKYTKKGRWTRPSPINNKTINTSFFDGAPTLTADESTMYFVSDRQGDKTMSDIYVVQKVGNSWGEAKRLPAPINTKGNETTPYVTPDGKYLFYSSDSGNGMGGYDVYVTHDLGNGKWADPVNIGPEFNTVNNDIYFRYYPKLNKAFVSSFRIIGMKASMDIYSIGVNGWKVAK